MRRREVLPAAQRDPWPDGSLPAPRLRVAGAPARPPSVARRRGPAARIARAMLRAPSRRPVIGCGPSRTRIAHVRPSGPVVAGTPRRAAAHRDRGRVEGAAAPVGPQPAPDVLVPGELSGGLDPRLHRAVL